MNNKYQNGKIYKIVNDSIPGVYYGSTIKTLEERLRGHKNDCKKNNCSSSELFKQIYFPTFFNASLCDTENDFPSFINFFIILICLVLNFLECSFNFLLFDSLIL